MTVVPGDLPDGLGAHPSAQVWIEFATLEIDAQKWICAGKNPDEGIIMLASHYLTLAPAGGGGQVQGGLTTGETRGGVSIAVTHGSAGAGAHAGSLYGQTYDQTLLTIGGKRRRYLPPPPQPA